MRAIKFATIGQVISWMFFFGEDFTLELLLTGSGLAILSVLLMPVLMSLIYLVFEGKIEDPTLPKWENRVNLFGIWILENVFIWVLTRGIEIPQKSEFFNGIEYVLFPLFNVVVPALIISAWKLISYLFKKYVDV